MSNRGADASWLAESAKRASAPVHLCRVEFDDETFCLTDAYTDVAWNGDIYDAWGGFAGYEDIKESSELGAVAVTFQLSGVDRTWPATLLTKRYIHRPLKLYLAFLDLDNGGLVGEPVLLFEGRMDQPEFPDDPDSDDACVVSITASGSFVDFERKSGWHTNDSEQQALFPDDKGMEFASEENKKVLWGRT